MKRILSSVLILSLIFATMVTTHAANGDIAGHIYSTDIRAYINGVEVESYNIGGKTAVVIEDLFGERTHLCTYNDDTRTLKFSGLAPSFLEESKGEKDSKPGKIIGNVYETDIKTSVYDVEIPSYNIGGKTAVAIEDLGCNGEFSAIGGKFIWDEVSRTISLEFLYPNTDGIPKDKKTIITANEDMTEAKVTFEEVLHCGGHEEFSFPEYVTDDTDIETVMPIKTGDETIGYYFRRPSDTYKFTAFTYYYPDKVKEAEKTFTPYPWKTRENIITHFLTNHSVGEPRERFDTDNYSFVYISVAGTSWTAYNLLQVYEDGTYIDYKEQIHMNNRSPQNLKVDKENQKVTFRHADRYHSEWYADYEIDLKEGTIKKLYNNEDHLSSEKKTMTLSQFMEVDKAKTTSIEIYTGATNHQVDIDRFFEIADKCMITEVIGPNPLGNDGMYIGIISDGFLSNFYISKDGGIDIAVPASGRQLNAIYTIDDVSMVDEIMKLIP